MSNPVNKTLADDQHGIIDRLVNSDYFFVQPWFMGASVAVLLLTIILTVVFTILFKRQKRKNSREAILNLSEDQTILEPKCSSRKPCAIVTTCVILIILIVLFQFVANHMRAANECFSEVVTKTWNCVVLVVTQPWFIGIVFGALLVTAILFKVHWILEDKQNSKKTKRRLARRGAPKQSVFSQPWFVAFLCAVVLIIILSVALFYLLVQKQGEEFWDTASRFFLIEPWFFGIVVGVVLVTLIVFSIFRILRGSGENYRVDENDQLRDRDIVVESQGFDEYPSKNTAVAQTSANPVNNQEAPSKPVSLPITHQEQEQPQSPQQQQQIKNNNFDYDQHVKSSAAVQTVMPSLSLQLNDGHFYDEKQFHDEDDSMAEYGLGENDQFNDEGSFIGLYNRDRIQNYMAQFNKNQLNN